MPSDKRGWLSGLSGKAVALRAIDFCSDFFLCKVMRFSIGAGTREERQHVDWITVQEPRLSITTTHCQGQYLRSDS